jgi:SAM-dependent methyltransferase
MLRAKARCYELRDRYYANVPSRDKLLYAAVASRIKPTTRLLDAGCGSDAVILRRHAHQVYQAVGVDQEEVFKEGLEVQLVAGDLENLPFCDNTFDLIVSRSVCEHLEHPLAVFRELKRILRPQGEIILYTPNKFYYSSLAAHVIPPRLRHWLLVQMFGQQAYEVFPAHYRANTRGSLKRLSREAGLELEQVTAIRAYPWYFLFSTLLFRLGILYDRLITRFRLDFLQSGFLVVLRKLAGRT